MHLKLAHKGPMMILMAIIDFLDLLDLVNLNYINNWIKLERVSQIRMFWLGGS